MNETKPLWQSVTFWGVVIAGVAAVVQAVGLGELAAPEQQQLAEGLTHLGELIGLALAIYGRIRARHQIGLTKEPQ